MQNKEANQNPLGMLLPGLSDLILRATGRHGHRPPAAPPGAVPTTLSHLRQQRLNQAMSPLQAMLRQAHRAETRRIQAQLFGDTQGKNRAYSLLSHALASVHINKNIRPFLQSAQAEMSTLIKPHPDVNRGPLPAGTRRPGLEAADSNAEIQRQYRQRMQHFLKGQGYGVEGTNVLPQQRPYIPVEDLYRIELPK